MGFFASLAGSVEAELVSANVPELLSCFGKNGIELREIRHVDLLTVRILIPRSAYRAAERLAQKHGASLKLLKRRGIYWSLKQLKHRPVILFGILILVFLTLFLPSRVLFIRVEGNQSIPSGEIIEKAGTCGICFGASRREVRSEKMKNSLLEAIPELQWAGINTSGCTAVITVKERDTQEEAEKSGGVSSLVAVRDGIVESCTVTAGSPLCRTGQAVKAGEILISGYTDCGISIKAQRAEGEIFAQTVRSITAVTPLNYRQKGEETQVIKKFSLILGKKRINFFKDSGISGITCDKMYKEIYVTLPGGFQLPVAVAVETWTLRDAGAVQTDSTWAQNAAGESAEAYLLQQMISGRILDAVFTENQDQNVYWLTGSYLCSEMIARERNEEIIENYGKNN